MKQFLAKYIGGLSVWQDEFYLGASVALRPLAATALGIMAFVLIVKVLS